MRITARIGDVATASNRAHGDRRRHPGRALRAPGPDSPRTFRGGLTTAGADVAAVALDPRVERSTPPAAPTPARGSAGFGAVPVGLIDGAPAPAAPETIARDATGRATVRAVRISEPIRVDATLDESVPTRRCSPSAASSNSSPPKASRRPSGRTCGSSMTRRMSTSGRVCGTRRQSPSGLPTRCGAIRSSSSTTSTSASGSTRSTTGATASRS